MIKYSQFILSTILVIAFIFFASQKTYPQQTQDTSKSETTNSLSTKPDGTAYVSGVTTGRTKAIATGLLGLISLAVSWRSKARSSQTGAKVALALGLIAILLSIVHLSTTAGAVFGSGSGKAGAIVALIVGLAGITLSIITLRSRRIS